MASKADEEHPPQAPKAKNKWLTASVVEDATEVVGRLFDEADRRDPTHTRRWVALVDGNNHQIDRIGAEAQSRGIDVTIVVDLVHVLHLSVSSTRWRCRVPGHHLSDASATWPA